MPRRPAGLLVPKRTIVFNGHKTSASVEIVCITVGQKIAQEDRSDRPFRKRRMDLNKLGLQCDVATVCRAWDAGKLSAAEIDQLRFAVDLINLPEAGLENVATAAAIIGTMAKDHRENLPLMLLRSSSTSRPRGGSSSQ